MRLAGILLAATLGLTGCGSRDPGGSGSDLPGGSAGRSVLSEQGLLDDDGQVRFPGSAPGGEVQAALCGFLFGTPEQVARAAELEGKTSLNDDSGFATSGGSGGSGGSGSSGSGGQGFRCAYELSGKTVLSLVLWTRTLDVPRGDVGELVSTRVRPGLQGYSAYFTSYPGRTMSGSTARTWLAEAGRRVAGA